MNKIAKNILLLPAFWFLSGCGHSKPSQEVLAAINHIEKNSIMPRAGQGGFADSVTQVDPRLEKSNYLRFYSLQDDQLGRKIQAKYVSHFLADSIGRKALSNKFKLKNYDNVYYVTQETFPTYIRNGGCSIVTLNYDMNTKQLSQYTQDLIFTGKEISNGICNPKHQSYNRRLDLKARHPL